MNFANLRWAGVPFSHWVAMDFIPSQRVIAINNDWPKSDDLQWHVEARNTARKTSITFPRRLPLSPQRLAEDLYSKSSIKMLSDIVGMELLPDPWFMEGPLAPRLGGGLHEIWPGGLLRMHVDFDAHPTGLLRAVNLLIYLNEYWNEDWEGALELGDGAVKIYPHGGTAVLFPTHGYSWHGHPKPLACPIGKTRRSLALYYYTRSDEPPARKTTVYV